jgi:hypothetical protein
MKYRAAYTLIAEGDLSKRLEFPIESDLDGRLISILEFDSNGRALATVEGRVHREGLKLAEWENDRFPRDRATGIKVPEDAEFRYRLVNVTNAITFLTDVAIRISRRPQDDALMVEDEEDQRRFRDLGTSELDRAFPSWATIRSFSSAEIEPEGWNALLDKESGLALYTSALLQKEPIGMFR